MKDGARPFGWRNSAVLALKWLLFVVASVLIGLFAAGMLMGR